MSFQHPSHLENITFQKMENLTGILEIVDRHSHAIPEGDYLLLCNMMKNIHIVMSEKRAPDNRETGMRICQLNLKRSKIKERRNVTEKIKQEAIKERLCELGLDVRIDTNIERLRQRGIIIGDEKKFYKSYLSRYNEKQRREIRMIDDEINILRGSLSY